MTDHVSPERRAYIMSRVPQKHTTPELALRRALHALGYRFRLHRRDLPGSPDLVFPSRRKVIFVHGCFWHGHGCRWGRLPKTRLDYWQSKIETNHERDRAALVRLSEAGWTSMVVWQCEIRDLGEVVRCVERFLDE
ncbi:very short patch repair endonuclease [Cereibacter changlensis]|uniref:very short patch repair endonuclease n=1 Tax=Cereibacter changlensis TaxID=402884 RepID=UPI0040338C23